MPVAEAITFMGSGSVMAQNKNQYRNFTSLSYDQVVSVKVGRDRFGCCLFGRIIGRKVTNQNVEPISNTTISIPGTSVGIITDIKGNYNAIFPNQATLVSSLVGFENRFYTLFN